MNPLKRPFEELENILSSSMKVSAFPSSIQEQNENTSFELEEEEMPPNKDILQNNLSNSTLPNEENNIFHSNKKQKIEPPSTSKNLTFDSFLIKQSKQQGNRTIQTTLDFVPNRVEDKNNLKNSNHYLFTSKQSLDKISDEDLASYIKEEPLSEITNNISGKEEEQPSNESIKNRRLPGPLGSFLGSSLFEEEKKQNLPSNFDSSEQVQDENSPSSLFVKSKMKLKGRTLSDFSQEEFLKPAWISMLEFLSLLPTENGSSSRKLKCSISLVKKKIRVTKIPQLVAMLKKCVSTDFDSAITLVDPTGEIEGTLHKQVMVLHPEICVGTVLILRKIAVFTTSPNTHFLNVTPDNIVKHFLPNCSYPSTYKIGSITDPKLIYDLTEKPSTPKKLTPLSSKQPKNIIAKMHESVPPTNVTPSATSKVSLPKQPTQSLTSTPLKSLNRSSTFPSPSLSNLSKSPALDSNQVLNNFKHTSLSSTNNSLQNTPIPKSIPSQISGTSNSIQSNLLTKPNPCLVNSLQPNLNSTHVIQNKTIGSPISSASPQNNVTPINNSQNFSDLSMNTKQQTPPIVHSIPSQVNLMTKTNLNIPSNSSYQNNMSPMASLQNTLSIKPNPLSISNLSPNPSPINHSSQNNTPNNSQNNLSIKPNSLSISNLSPNPSPINNSQNDLFYFSNLSQQSSVSSVNSIQQVHLTPHAPNAIQQNQHTSPIPGSNSIQTPSNNSSSNIAYDEDLEEMLANMDENEQLETSDQFF